MKIAKSQINKFRVTTNASSVKIINDQEELVLTFETIEEVDELISALKSIRSHVSGSLHLNGQAVGPYYYTTGTPFDQHKLGINTCTSNPNSNITSMSFTAKAETIYDPTEDKDLKPVSDSAEEEQDENKKHNSSTIKEAIRTRCNELNRRAALGIRTKPTVKREKRESTSRISQPTNYNISHERELKNIKNAKSGDFATVKAESLNGIREMIYEFDGNNWHMIDAMRYTQTTPTRIDTLQVKSLSELYEMDSSELSKYDLILQTVDYKTYKIYKYSRKAKKIIYIGTRTITNTVGSGRDEYTYMINEMFKRSKVACAADFMSGVHNIFYDLKDLEKIEDCKENDEAVLIIKAPSYNDIINMTKFRFSDNSWTAISFDQCKTNLELDDFIKMVNVIKEEQIKHETR